MIREVKFESQDRRIKQILAALNENGIKDIEEANKSVKKLVGSLQDLRRNPNDLFRKCKVGLRGRFCHRIEERMQERSRRCRSYRYRLAGFLYSGFCGRRP